MKIRTLNDLADKLNDELAWRLGELRTLEALLNAAPPTQRTSIARASTCMAYAHWEGYIKHACTFYLAYISTRRLPFSDIKSSLLAMAAEGEISTAAREKNHLKMIGLITVLTGESNHSQRFNSSSVNLSTLSNLDSISFSRISAYLGIDPLKIVPTLGMIDDGIVEPRHEIAHGSYALASDVEALKRMNNVSQFLRKFKEELLEHAAKRLYRRPH